MIEVQVGKQHVAGDDVDPYVIEVRPFIHEGLKAKLWGVQGKYEQREKLREQKRHKHNCEPTDEGHTGRGANVVGHARPRGEQDRSLSLSVSLDGVGVHGRGQDEEEQVEPDVDRNDLHDVHVAYPPVGGTGQSISLEPIEVET